MATIAAEVAASAISRNASARARDNDRVPAGGRRTQRGSGNRARSAGIRPSQFAIIGIALAIGLVTLVGAGKIGEGVVLALLAFLVIGAIIPAVMLPVGAVVLIALFFKGDVGTKFLTWLGGLGSSPPASPSLPVTSLSPSPYVPGSQSNSGVA